MKLPSFFGGNDVQRSLNMADNRCINLVPITNDDGSVRGFTAAPGLLLYGTSPNGAISGMYVASNGRCFFMSGNTLYEITAGATITARGSTFGSAATTAFTDNGIDLVLVNGIGGWRVNFSTMVAAAMPAGFPSGCKNVGYMNGRVVGLDPNTQNFYVSEVLDASTWDVLNVQSSDSNPDVLIGSIVLHNEVRMFSRYSSEAFYDSGTIPSPFVRNNSSIAEVGSQAPYSIAKIDNTVYFLGGTLGGSGVIYKMAGYTPQRVSNYTVETAIQGMTDTTDALAFAMQLEGNHFYTITFPTGGRTFCYNINTGLWHELANFLNGEFERFEANGHVFFDDKHLTWDDAGNIYSFSYDTHAYGSTPRKWVRSFRVPAKGMERVRHSRLQLDMEVGTGLIDGTDIQVMMRYSDDGGHSWSSERWASAGEIGETTRRVIWHRLGATKGQPRIYELSGTAACRTTLLNVYLD